MNEWGDNYSSSEDGDEISIEDVSDSLIKDESMD